MTRQLFFWTVSLALTALPIVTVAQQTNTYKIKYTKYSSDGKVIKDTTVTDTKYSRTDKYDPWTFIIAKDTVVLSDASSCNCQILVYDKDKLIQSVLDTTDLDWHQYGYNAKGQLTGDEHKYTNLPWMTTNYEYDDKGRLKKEISNTARYGDYSVEYIYDKDKLIMKITNDNNHIDTLKINPK